MQIKNIYGYTHTIKDGRVKIGLGDIFSGQERNILIRVNAPTENLGRHRLVTASLEFTDILKDKQTVSLQRELAYEVTEDKAKVTANEDKKFIARGVSVDAADEMYQATTYYEKGDRESALNNIKRALGRITMLNNSHQRTEATMKQEAELGGLFNRVSSTLKGVFLLPVFIYSGGLLSRLIGGTFDSHLILWFFWGVWISLGVCLICVPLFNMAETREDPEMPSDADEIKLEAQEILRELNRFGSRYK